MKKSWSLKKFLHQFFNDSVKTIFWGWNLIFLIILLYTVPLIGIFFILATITGEIPWDFSLTLLGLILIPLISVYLGWKHFRQQPSQLMRLFYGVEAPLFILCLIRLFLIRELTPASAMFLTTLVLCIGAFFGEMLYGYLGFSPPIPSQKPLSLVEKISGWIGQKNLIFLQMACHSLMLLMGIYAAILILFYAVPVALFIGGITFKIVNSILISFFSFSWVKSLLSPDVILGIALFSFSLIFGIIVYSLMFLLFIFSSALFVIMPSVFGLIYIQSGKRVLVNFSQQYGQKKTLLGSLSIVTLWLILFIFLQNQPQTTAFNLLEKEANTDQIRQTLLSKSDLIKKGLVNAYLLNYRYLSAVSDNNHILAMYSSLGFPKPFALSLQNLYNGLMSPFLYQGANTDIKRAEKLYVDFFDTPIEKGEPSSIKHALQATYNRDEVKAGLLNINEQKVWLSSQNINLQEWGDYGEIELHEVYQNQTSDPQEIFYYFSLPESTTITGLWLGDTDNLSQRFEFTVSPRGAAQKVYNSQVQVRQDPALLEQVGPRNYRLRAFPIPPKSFVNNPNFTRNNPPKEMHLWLTYKVLKQPQGWSLPQLVEQRNIFWTKDTKRTYQGQEIKLDQNLWLPPFLPSTSPYLPQSHQITFSQENQIIATPLKSQDYVDPQGQKFALILDTSRSMKTQLPQLQKLWDELKKASLKNNQFDIYLTRSEGMKPQKWENLNQFSPLTLTFYGNLTFENLLQQFNQLRGQQKYDYILVITDRGNYELSRKSQQVFNFNTPLWMIHLGGMAPAYEDSTLKAIQDSRGGVSTNLSEVLQRLGTQAKLGESIINITEGYSWSYRQVKSLPNPSPISPQFPEFTPIAARQFVSVLSQNINLARIETLDKIHQIAKQFKMVTPYSSMIVLVNDQQRELLKQAEAQTDRFDRQVESGKEELTKPINPLKQNSVQSDQVPEPETWFALILGGIFLIILRTRYRQKNLS